jgi:hypothetical protein
MPAFGLGEPFSSVLRFGLGTLYAPQLHDAAIVVAHRTPPLFPGYQQVYSFFGDRVTKLYVADFFELLA